MKKGLLFLIIVCAACRQTPHPADVVKDDFDFAARQLKFAFTQVEQPKAVAARDWCSGFFPGELWYMYEYTGNDYWRRKAEEFTAPVGREGANDDTDTPDIGFNRYCSFGNGYRLTHNLGYRNILIKSAETLITRYKENVGCLRSQDHGSDKWQYPVTIDNLMNLELLFWAFKQTNHEEFYHVAVSHARTTARNHFRSDYSSLHVVDYDTITGEALKRDTQQGYAHGSAYSLGQAWGLYGYTMCYRETNLPEFLQHAKRIAGYIFTHPSLPEDLIPYRDHNTPDVQDRPRDVPAAAVAASALYELSMYDRDNTSRYKKWADTIIENLSANYRTALYANHGLLLLDGTGSVSCSPEAGGAVACADYYFLEALLRKSKFEKEGNALL